MTDINPLNFDNGSLPSSIVLKGLKNMACLIGCPEMERGLNIYVFYITVAMSGGEQTCV